MKFTATLSTEDGRLTKGKEYQGDFISKVEGGWGNMASSSSLRIVVFDDKNQWMTFDPKVFVPSESTNG